MKFLFALLLVAVAAQAISLEAKDDKGCPGVPAHCICILVFDPIVSANGCYYTNSCFMECSGGKPFQDLSPPVIPIVY